MTSIQFSTPVYTWKFLWKVYFFNLTERKKLSFFLTPARTLCTVSASISVQRVRCFGMVFLICAYVHFRLSLEFLGLKIKNLKTRDGGRVKEFRPNLFLWFPLWSDENSWSSVFLKILDDLGRGLDALTVQRVPSPKHKHCRNKRSRTL